MNELKKKSFFTVVIGNPPYSIMSGNLSQEARRIVDSFRFVDGELIREKMALNVERTIQDDYVKFFALARNLISTSGSGVLGYISNNSYQSNINLRGMRNELFRIFKQIEIVDLHGAALHKQTDDFGQKDENVFDIRTAVAIFIGSTDSKSGASSINRCDLIGSRAYKNKVLKVSIATNLTDVAVDPRSPKYIFLPTNREVEDIFNQGISIEALFNYRASGVKTGKDEVLIDFSKTELKEKLSKFTDPSFSESEIAKVFGCNKGHGKMLLSYRKSIEKDEFFDQRIVPLMFTPFDNRFVFYRKDIVDVHSDDVSRQILSGKNLNLIVVRQVSGRPFTHVFVTRSLANQRSFYSTLGATFQVPVMHIEDRANELAFEGDETNFIFNQARRLIPQELLVNTENLLRLFYFIYAQMFSREYRDLFKDELQRDYPRVFKAINFSLFNSISDLGKRLAKIHCGDENPTEDPSLNFVGSFNKAVERPSFIDGTIWLDKDQTMGFSGVPVSVWNLEVGGYQVCEKWLKDRKNRKLSKSDRDQFICVLATLLETLKIQDSIDSVIQENGGWEKSFVVPSS